MTHTARQHADKYEGNDVRARLAELSIIKRWEAIALAFKSADLATVDAIVGGRPHQSGISEEKFTWLLIFSGRLRKAITDCKAATSPSAIANGKSAFEALARDVLVLGQNR